MTAHLDGSPCWRRPAFMGRANRRGEPSELGATLALILVASVCCFGLTPASPAKVVFHAPFDGSMVAVTPGAEILPSSGIMLVDDVDMNLTFEQMARGEKKTIVVGGETIDAHGDAAVEFVPGLRGKAARLGRTISYSIPFTKDMESGTVVIWYKNPEWQIIPWCNPAIASTAQGLPIVPGRREASVSRWVFDRYTCPPAKLSNGWKTQELDDGVVARVLEPGREADDSWHTWVLRWSIPKKQIEVFDDGVRRRVEDTSDLLKQWDAASTSLGDSRSSSRQGFVRLNLSELISGSLYMARDCVVTIDEVLVWDEWLPDPRVAEVIKRGMAGEVSWKDSEYPDPAVRLDRGMDLTGLDPNRPALPPAVEWSDEGAYIVETPSRKLTCLNGYWRYQPGKNRMTSPDPAEWNYMRIPGIWSPGQEARQRVFDQSFNVTKPPDPVSTPDVPGIGEEKQDGGLDDEFDIPEEMLSKNDRVDRMDLPTVSWFERDIFVPLSQKGWRFFLFYDRFYHYLTRFDLYVNGNFVKRVKTYGPGRIDITDHMNPGRDNRIAIAVEEDKLMMLDLYLDARRWPDVTTSDIYMIPSWRDRSIAVEFEAWNHTDHPVTFHASAEFSDWRTGKEAHSIEGRDITLAPGEKRITSVEGPWQDPHGWSIHDPFLYTAQLVLSDSQGVELDRSYPVRFGFREIWCENGWLMMNGSKLHMRGRGHGSSYRMKGPVDSTEYGFGAERMFLFKKQYNNYWERGIYGNSAHEALSAADEIGGVYTCQLRATGYDGQVNYKGRIGAQAQSIAMAKWLRNHPSLVSYIARQNPPGEMNMASSDFESHIEEHPDWPDQVKHWHQYVDPIKRVHPTALFHGFWRPFGDMAQFGSKPGYGVALQSREEFPRSAAFKDRAIFNAEVGWPQISRYCWDCTGELREEKGREFYFARQTQVVEELAAMYFGDRAYDTNATVGTMGTVWKTSPGGTNRFDWEYVSENQVVGLPYTREFEGPFVTPAAMMIRGLYNKRNVIAWRWYGYGYWLHTEHSQYVDADPRYVGLVDEKEAERIHQDSMRKPGIVFDDGASHCANAVVDREELKKLFPLSDLGKIMEKEQRPLVAWVMGWPDPMEKDHAFYEDETITKQIGVMNEFPWPVSPVVEWKVIDLNSGDAVKTGELKTSFETGDQQLHKIEFTLSPCGHKKRYRIELTTLLDGKTVHDHSFDIQTFPRKKGPVPTGRIGLIDSGGTGERLNRAGIKWEPVTAKTDLSGFDLLIIGRKSDQQQVKPLLKELDIDTRIAAGLNVLVMEQEGDVLDRPDPDSWPKVMIGPFTDAPELVSYGLRQERSSVRNVFIRDRNNAMFEGLDDEDLADWRGESNLIEPYKPEKWYKGPRSWRRRRRHNWSNFGDVATYVFEKPQGGNFVSILDAGFDLLYTALLEERRAGGAVIRSQLSFGGRYGKDPVATMLFNRLVAYALSVEPEVGGRVAFAGRKLWLDTLRSLPFALNDVTGKNVTLDPKETPVLIIGLGIPGIEDFDSENRFAGIKAAPAVPEKVDEAKKLDAEIEDIFEAATDGELEGADGLGVMDETTKKKQPGIKVDRSGPDPALAWIEKNRDMLLDYVNNGGNVLVLPVQASRDLKWLPFDMEMKQVKVFACDPGNVFKECPTIGPADLYWRRAIEIPVPSNLPEDAVATDPAVVSRVPCGKGEIIFVQVHPGMFYGNWPEVKLLRLYSALLTSCGVADRADTNLTGAGYSETGYPYFGCTLYFLPYLCTSW